MLLRSLVSGSKSSFLPRLFSPTATSSASRTMSSPLDSMWERSRWLDVSTIRRDGKTIDGKWENVPLFTKNEAVPFPAMEACTLEQQNVSFPNGYEADVKLVCISFHQAGFDWIRAWMNPFLDKFPAAKNNSKHVTKNGKSVAVLELSIVEFGFLRMVKSTFANNLKALVPANRINDTVLSFGGLMVSNR